MHDFRKDRWADTVENFPHKQLTKSVSTRFVFSGWETLPKEILLQVFSDAHPDCSPNARLVCKWWKQNHDSALLELRPVRLDLASLPSLFPNTTSLDTSRTFGRVWPSLDCHDALVQVRRSLLDLTRLSKLRELDLSGAGSLTYKGSSMGIDCNVLEIIAGRLLSLRRLSLARCPLLRPAGLSALSPLTCLEELSLQGCEQLRDGGMHVIAGAVPSLTSLSVAGCVRLTDVGVRALSSLRVLQSLDTSDCPLIRGTSHSAIPSLVDVSLSGCHWLMSISPLILIASHLTRLNLSRCVHLADFSLSLVLPSLTTLRSLDLSHCSLLSEGALSFTSGLSNLTWLDISGCTQFSDRTLKAVACSALKLRSLSADGCMGITGSGLAEIAALLLESLSLCDCHRLSDRGILSLARGKVASTLEVLKIESAKMSSSTALVLASSMPRLKTLQLFNPTRLTAVGAHGMLWALSPGCSGSSPPREMEELLLAPCDTLGSRLTRSISLALPYLKSLSLGPAPGLRQVSVLSGLQRLTALSLQELDNVPSRDWAALGPLPFLQSLTAFRCAGVDNRALDGLSLRMPRLSHLCVSGCEHVGDEGILCASACPMLGSLDISETKATDASLWALAGMDLCSINIACCATIAHAKCRALAAPVSSAELRQQLTWTAGGDMAGRRAGTWPGGCGGRRGDGAPLKPPGK